MAKASAAAKKKATKERQALRRKDEKEKVRAQNFEERCQPACSALRLGTMTTVDPKAKSKPQPKKLAHDPPKFDAIVCKDCGAVAHWREMPATWVLEHREEMIGDEPDRWTLSHRCVPCEAKATGKSEAEVRATCLAAPMASKRWRADQYQTKLAEKRDEFAATNASNRMIKMITRNDMNIILEPLGQYLLRKKTALDMVVKDVEEHERLCRALENATSLQEERAIMAQMEKLEVDDKYLAFSEQVDQHAWIQACSFSDSWTQILDDQGQLVGGMCSYYPCFGNTRDLEQSLGIWIKQPCCRIIPSKEWNRNSDDPTMPRMRYYCFCGKKFNAGWGQLVEIKRRNTRGEMDMWYMRADVPSWDIEDVRAMYLEDHVGKGCSSPQQLYDKLKVIKPTHSSLVIDDPTMPGVAMHTTKELFFALPEFSWWEIFTFAGVAPPKGVKRPAVLRMGVHVVEDLEEC